MRITECSAVACVGVPTLTTYQSVSTILRLLLLLLSGTVCLNCYKEAVTRPKCTPFKEAGGRTCLYGSNIVACILIFVVIAQLVTVPRDDYGGGWADLAAVVVFIYIGAINVILVVCACAGRCLLAEEGVDSYDDDDSSDNEREVNVEKGMTVVEQTNPVLVKAVVE